MNQNKVKELNKERLYQAEYVGDRTPAIICDVDGTVALMMGQRKPFEYGKAFSDNPNYPVIDMVFAAKSMLEHKLTGDGPDFVKVALIMLSARENILLHENAYLDSDGAITAANFSDVEQLTSKWLDEHMTGPLGESYDKLYMREKGDFRKDSYVKFELYSEYIEPYYDVKYVFDDRDQVVDMWRNGCKLTCLQVADGNF